MNEAAATDIATQLIAIWQAVRNILTNTDLASFASIIGAILSFWVLISVSDLRKRVLFRMRAPEALKDLTARASAVSNAMLNFSNGLPAIEENLALANETLKNVYKKISGEPRETIKAAINGISKFRALPDQAKTRELARDVYLKLLVSTRAIEHAIADVREEP